MQQIQQQINLYHTLFYVCLGLCVFFLLLSVLFFFKFDIRGIFNARTGRSVRKTVESVEAKNAHTGQLRKPPGRGYTGTLSRTGGLGRSGNLTPSKRLARVRKASMEELIQPPPKPKEPQEGATVSSQSMETQVLNQEERGSTLEEARKEADQSCGMFRIEKYTLLVHTDEVV